MYESGVACVEQPCTRSPATKDGLHQSAVFADEGDAGTVVVGQGRGQSSTQLNLLRPSGPGRKEQFDVADSTCMDSLTLPVVQSDTGSCQEQLYLM